MRDRQRVGATAAFGIVAGSLALLLLCSALLIGMGAHSLVQIPAIPTVSDLPTATSTATHPPATATATTPPCNAASAGVALQVYVAHKPPTQTPTPMPSPSPSPSPHPTMTPSPTVPPNPCGK